MFSYEYWGNEVFDSRFNMAVEEYLLRRAATEKTAAVRFFSFPRDSVILGYAQATDAIKKYDSTFDVARRPTGGSHVQVGPNILAYTFVVPRNGQFSNFEDMRAYYADHVADTLSSLGIDSISVDNRASTINVDGKIVASHAIIWGVKSALLHGMIVLDPYDIKKVSERVYLAERKIGDRTYTEYSALENIPAASMFLKKVAPDLIGEARQNVIKQIIGNAILERVTEGEYKNYRVNHTVAAEAFKLAREKYLNDFWTRQRNPAFDKQEIESIPGEELKGSLRENLGYCLFSQVEDKDFKKMASNPQ